MPNIDIQENGVYKLLKGLNPRKASGPDGIPSKLLQALAKELAPPLTMLFKSSLQTGQIPQVWRHALVQPIFKKGDKSQAANYRPISLTCICCKMLEHIVRHAITDHLEHHKILCDEQHGFRKRRSCETQLIMTMEDLSRELDSKGQTDTILLDFSKAFDKVPHERLSLKLEHYGIRGQTLSWIRAFLANRTQEVVVEGTSSHTGRVTAGVPQGSVLGPTLFLVFINDLGKNIQSKIRLFADDTILYRAIRSRNDQCLLQKDLDALGEWERKWLMEFNVTKCHVLSVTDKQKPLPPTYTLHGHTLEEVKSAKYLGVELTSHINWKNHVTNITAKANRTSAFVYRNLKGCPTSVQTHCYKGLVRPVMEYASPVWDPHQEYLRDMLENVQKRSARRIMHNFDRDTDSNTLVRDLGLQTLKERRRIDKVTVMHKIQNKLVDIEIPPQLQLKDSITRGAPKKFQPLHSNKNCGLHSFFSSAARLWSNLPPSALSATTVSAFRGALKEWAVLP
jgi:hypothetical protein